MSGTNRLDHGLQDGPVGPASVNLRPGDKTAAPPVVVLVDVAVRRREGVGANRRRAVHLPAQQPHTGCLQLPHGR